MSIRCGHCKETHETVADVRACAGQPYPASTAENLTERQLDLINKLRAQRGLPALPIDVKISKREASATISGYIAENSHKGPNHLPVTIPDRYVRCENKTRHSSEMSAHVVADKHPPKDFVVQIPAGYYATPSKDTGVNDIDFWMAQRPTEGKWAGFTFVKRILGGHPPIRISRSIQADALKAIEEYGVEKAALLFGTELGRCYKCGRSLTDATSRQLGVGPGCRSKAA